ncbi:hypothetical protein [Tautonia plasticadhaerens]|uniref:Glycosyltransferase RgtA/B/C/D-like domain-containing protein n=1 Tax=Tautonia plasticadhaerens TaxID=2527974 RepID=A0A518HCF1_9BACT|nr:hypothetical protein [Tautonia plasticadhaerens]QDV38542.1 hypothetical protein ElP_64970 [Tautonia plasticadhaerens]
MKRLVPVAFALTIALAASRSAFFLANAAVLYGDPLEAFYLESKFVHLCWRAQAGEALYPDYRIEPHVANFFSPLYFLLVGGLGRLADADLDALTRIGRLGSVGPSLAAALVVGLASGRRYGRRAGVLSGLIGLSSAPLMPFGAMARPDLLADTLGFAGFLAAISARPRRQWIGAALLGAAILTKQTSGVYLLAASAGLLASGRWKASAAVGLGPLLAVGAIVGVATVRDGPMFVLSLLGEREMGWDPVFWVMANRAIVERAPELPYFAAVGLVLWVARRPREPALAALAVLVPAAAVVTSAKIGSDLNYFLGLRLVSAMGAGAAWGAELRRPEGGEQGGPARPRPRPRWGWLAVALVGTLAMVPGLRDAARVFGESRAEARFYSSDRGRAVLEAYRLFFDLAEDPDRPILTDSGPILLRMRGRAPFADPWLFRSLAIDGRLRPDDLRRRVVRGEFEAVISTGDLRAPIALNHQFLLPPGLIVPVRASYLPAFAIDPGDDRHALYVDLPRVRVGPPPPQVVAASRLAPRTVDPGPGPGEEGR